LYNVISDIAGQYKTLQALLAKMPPGVPVSVGDMVDRGPDSDKVIDFFRTTPGALAVLGNHEHMLLDQGAYDYGIWEHNGGGATLRSYGGQVPDDVKMWLWRLPLHLKLGKFLVSHTFLRPHQNILKSTQIAASLDSREVERYVWYRGDPTPRKGIVQICGHNSQMGLKHFRKARARFDYAVCLDDSHKRKLTGMHLPTMEIFQQDYID
jgi:hypothetical protein